VRTKQLEQVVAGTDELPLTTYLVVPSQQELPETSCLFYLAEDRLWQFFPQAIPLFSLLRPQLAPHPVDY